MVTTVGGVGSRHTVLLRNDVLVRIRSGEISLVFRRWRKPTVRTGGALRTAIGVLNILDVREVRDSDITRPDLLAAGYATAAELLAALGTRDGQIFRIAVEYAGADPRIALRQQDDLSAGQLESIVARLHRLDSRSTTGPWTGRVLAGIERHPQVAARALAERLGCDRDWLKPQVRKLKNLGLTVSHHPGYALSARGRVVLDHLRAAAVHSGHG